MDGAPDDEIFKLKVIMRDTLLDYISNTSRLDKFLVEFLLYTDEEIYVDLFVLWKKMGKSDRNVLMQDVKELKLNKTDLVNKISFNTNFSKYKSSKLLNSLQEILTEAAALDNKIMIRGFGTFESVTRVPRKFRNPLNGKIQMTKKTITTTFKPSKVLIEKLNSGKKGKLEKKSKS